VSLLTIEEVSKRYRRGSREYVALRDVSMAIARDELVAVLGARKSGRSTLMRIAAGLERPDEGVVRFEGLALSSATSVVGHRICFCHASFSPVHGERVLDHAAAPLLAQRLSLRAARRGAESALERAAVAECASMRPDELNGAERVRVALARALAIEPRLLVVDDPTAGVGSLESDGILRLLRSLADEGVAVLMCTDDAMSISGAHRAFSLDAGVLRGEARAHSAEIVPLRPRAAARPGAHLG
jgi:ABC-type sugar transport system ATPase subunit